MQFTPNFVEKKLFASSVLADSVFALVFIRIIECVSDSFMSCSIDLILRGVQ